MRKPRKNRESTILLLWFGFVKSLITHRYDIDNAIEAYSILDEPSTLGIIIAIFAALFGILWFPIKRFLKKRRNTKQEKK